MSIAAASHARVRAVQIEAVRVRTPGKNAASEARAECDGRQWYVDVARSKSKFDLED
jgi:hypothetical protein